MSGLLESMLHKPWCRFQRAFHQVTSRRPLWRDGDWLRKDGENVRAVANQHFASNLRASARFDGFALLQLGPLAI